jgi:ABC-2 type transport system ATP-binding protein
LAAAPAAAAARRWAERLGLAEFGDAKLESLSLGNQQRVQLASALVHDPELLVLDEPFSGLDPVGVDAMSQVLRERAADGVTVLFSSHQLDLVEHLCEAVAIVHRGRLVAEGTVEELARADGRRLAVRVAGDRDAEWAAALDGLVRVHGVRSDGAASLDLAEGADPQTVLDAARAAGPVELFAFERRRLSEVFRAAVGLDVGEIERSAAAR